MKSYTVHIKVFLFGIQRLEEDFASKNLSVKNKGKTEKEGSSHGGRLSLSLPSKTLIIASKELRDKCSTSLRIILKLIKASFGEKSEPSIESIRPIEMIIHDVGIILWRLCQAKTIFLISLGRCTPIIVKTDDIEIDSIQIPGSISPTNPSIESETIEDKKEVQDILPLLLTSLEMTTSSSSFQVSTNNSTSTSYHKNVRSPDRFENIKVEKSLIIL